MNCLPALGALFILIAATGPTADQKKETLTYLHGLQTKEGGYRPSASAKTPSLRGTSASLRAIKYFGGTPKNPEQCRVFVQSCWDSKMGGFADTPGGKPDVVLTAVGLMALVELKAPLEGVEETAIHYMADKAKAFEEVRMAAAGLEAIGKKSKKNGAWLEQLAKLQNEDGSFGNETGQARDTGGSVAAILRLGGKIKDPEAIRKALNAGQRSDGGFGKATSKGSDLETSYRVMRTYHMLKMKPARAEGLREFVRRCRNKDGGYGVEPGEPSSAGGTYFASIILHWLDQE